MDNKSKDSLLPELIQFAKRLGVPEEVYKNFDEDEIFKMLKRYDEIKSRKDIAWDKLQKLMLNNTKTESGTLNISIDPGTAPNEEIASILTDLSAIYRKMGGSGIVFMFDDVTVNQEEVI